MLVLVLMVLVVLWLTLSLQLGEDSSRRIVRDCHVRRHCRQRHKPFNVRRNCVDKKLLVAGRGRRYVRTFYQRLRRQFPEPAACTRQDFNNGGGRKARFYFRRSFRGVQHQCQHRRSGHASLCTHRRPPRIVLVSCQQFNHCGQHLLHQRRLWRHDRRRDYTAGASQAIFKEHDALRCQERMLGFHCSFGDLAKGGDNAGLCVNVPVHCGITTG